MGETILFCLWMCLLVCEGGAISQGCCEGNWSIFLGLHLQILDWIVWHLFTVHRANKWKWAKAGGLFCYRNIHQVANIPSSCCFLLGLSFQALASFLYKIRRQISTFRSLYCNNERDEYLKCYCCGYSSVRNLEWDNWKTDIFVTQTDAHSGFVLPYCNSLQQLTAATQNSFVTEDLGCKRTEISCCL